jgi:hypothetical protein
MGDTYKITGYDAATQVVTVTFALAPRPGFTGATFTGVKVSNPPTDSVESVTAFFRAYADAYIAGKQAEAARAAAIDPSVAALLNVATSF